jgi:type III pantothenate kinase
MKALLLIDAGNSRIKWATVAPRQKLRPASEWSSAQATVTKIKALARKYPAHGVILSCVVPRLLPWFRAAFGKRLYILSSSSPNLPLTFDYPRPAELGADRIAAAIAVRTEGKFPAIIISCGTAIAYTVLNGKGVLCGGAIAPGLQAQLNALSNATAQLPVTAFRQPGRLPARSTAEALRAGVFHSFRGGMQETVAQLAKTFRTAPRVVITGGDAIHAALGPKVEVRPLLVLEGLRIMGHRIFNS